MIALFDNRVRVLTATTNDGTIEEILGPIGRWPGLFPLVRVFTRHELEQGLASAGFTIEHTWQPDKAVVFNHCPGKALIR